MSTLSELSEELDIVYWLDRAGVSYKLINGKSGMQAHIKECPCCGDRRWKVYINTDTGLGNCFICDTKFNKISFIKSHMNISGRDLKMHFVEVLKEQGWLPKKITPIDVDETKVILPDCSDISVNDKESFDYLENRGITSDLSAYFRFKYCKVGKWSWTIDGELKSQDFSNRIIIPVYDLDGKIVTFQGRDITGKSDKKYLFPAMLPGSGRFLYNGQNVGKAERVCVGEGVFDVLAIKKALDEDVTLRDVVPIGTFGKHMSSGDLSGDDQLGRFIRLKHDGLKEVTFMWDGEKDALFAALRAAELLSATGLIVKIALLPVGKDPNEIDASVVRDAYYKALRYTPSLAAKLMLKCPYPDKQKAKLYSLMS